MYLVFCNISPEESKGLARKLVSEKLATCISTIPGLMSYYWWKDRFCEDDEVTLMIKVKKENYDALLTRILELHPYKVPEVIAVAPEKVHLPYLAWVRGEDS
ncbi:MAG: divalent-cation tolerance protein CutA [Myxococcota bacterium]|jgi:periplasmic divalent cation tolerance protein|nr:divalent-cation tolerance protein CutA [Myxococcota bacterium]